MIPKNNPITLCMRVICFIIIISIVLSTIDNDAPVNLTETVIHKDISHNNGFSKSTDYYIYTTDNQFEIPLKEYNNIHKGDNVTVEYNNVTKPILHLGGNIYYAE